MIVMSTIVLFSRVFIYNNIIIYTTHTACLVGTTNSNIRIIVITIIYNV